MNKIKSIELEVPNMGLFRGVFVGLGGLLLTVGIIMMFTIVLILPGAGAFLVGTVFVYFLSPTVDAVCPACDSDISVRVYSRGHKCEACDTKTPIKWRKKKTKRNSWSALFGRDKKA